MPDVRLHYQEELDKLERSALAGLDLVVASLDRTMEAVEHQDIELAELVIADDDRIDGRYLEVHQQILTLLATQAPVATDLRLISALLHVMHSIERMGDQCVNISKVIPLTGHDAPVHEEMVDRILLMGKQARSMLSQAKKAFEGRDVELARDLVRQDDLIDNLNKECFRIAVQVGEDHDTSRVGDDDDAGRAGARADRRQRRGYRRAGRLRRHRALPRVRGRLAPGAGAAPLELAALRDQGYAAHSRSSSGSCRLRSGSVITSAPWPGRAVRARRALHPQRASAFAAWMAPGSSSSPPAPRSTVRQASVRRARVSRWARVPPAIAQAGQAEVTTVQTSRDGPRAALPPGGGRHRPRRHRPDRGLEEVRRRRPRAMDLEHERRSARAGEQGCEALPGNAAPSGQQMKVEPQGVELRRPGRRIRFAIVRRIRGVGQVS